jgi:hypothetical protein
LPFEVAFSEFMVCMCGADAFERWFSLSLTLPRAEGWFQ